MSENKRIWLKELWLNRPWKYIPEVIRMMKLLPFKKDSPRAKFRVWLRNMLYLAWQK